MKFKALLPVLTLLPAVCAAGDLDIAREALRDGLWEVARNYATPFEQDEQAQQIILESYAREGLWQKVLEASESIPYYRALALFELGRYDEVKALMEVFDFTQTDYAQLAARLKARLALAQNQPADALELLKTFDFAQAGPDARLEAATIYLANDNRAEAEKLWREVVAETNVTASCYVLAAVNLADVDLLRQACRRAPNEKLRRLAGVRLARALIAQPETFDEGAKLIRVIVKDAPDTDGARDAYKALADYFLTMRMYPESAKAYAEALEIWPVLAQDSQVQEGRGWGFRKLGKPEDALDAYARAEEVATNDFMRANAILLAGDTLSEMNRGEEAMQKYRQVLEKYPKTPAGEKLKVVVQLRELEANARERYKNYEFAEAQKLFAELAAKDPTRKERMAFYTVLCLYGQGLDREAYQHAQKLAETSEDATVRADATLWLAKIAYNRRRWKDSQRLFATFADMQPKSPEAPVALVWAARAAFAENDFQDAIQRVGYLIERYPRAPERIMGYLVQSEALIELARFDEAVLVLDRLVQIDGITNEEKFRAQVLRADALFAMGADNPTRYREALEAYRAVRLGVALDPNMQIAIAYKTALTLEKLKRMDEAIDEYYTSVVLAYREGRMKGQKFDDDASAAFARAAFHLADEFESRGKDFQAMHILELVVASDVPASDEAEKRIDRIQMKGNFL